jgi:hypothetical protein
MIKNLFYLKTQMENLFYSKTKSSQVRQLLTSDEELNL